jgi:TolB protein
MIFRIFLFAFSLLASSLLSFSAEPLLYPGEEKHLANVQQLTFGGQNAEAYFSMDNKYLIYQSTGDTFKCDQIFIMNVDGKDRHLVSTGHGACTCAFFVPGTDDVIFSSTHEKDLACPKKPDRSLGYVWGLFEYDLYKSRRDGSQLTRLTSTPGYDAEAAVSPDGKEIVFTSGRDGDLELYKMNVDGSHVQRLTYTVGYDGGPFFSPDGKYIVYRAFHPRNPAELSKWDDLWAMQAVSPVRLELWIMNRDGSGQRQVAELGGASFCPYMSPDGQWITFTSDYADTAAHGMPNFELYRIHPDGSGLEQITFSPGFEGFPMWSYDGKKLVFCSARGVTKAPHETNIFIADWKD